MLNMFVLVKKYFKLTIPCKNIHKASTSIFVTLPQITMYFIWILCDKCEVEVKYGKRLNFWGI